MYAIEKNFSCNKKTIRKSILISQWLQICFIPFLIYQIVTAQDKRKIWIENPHFANNFSTKSCPRGCPLSCPIWALKRAVVPELSPIKRFRSRQAETNQDKRKSPENVVFSGLLSVLKEKLSLGELRCATCGFEAVLLTLFHTRIAGEVTGGLEGAAVVLVDLQQGAGDEIGRASCRERV